MKKELQDELFKKYPKIFAQKDLPATKSCMCFGLECGDGWHWLIDNLCEAIQFEIDQKAVFIENNKSNPEVDLENQQIEVAQVKEKFGALCFYATNTTTHARNIIDFAEGLSNSICEICGSTKDVTQTKGWVKTLCKECLDKRLCNGKESELKTSIEWADGQYITILDPDGWRFDHDHLKARPLTDKITEKEFNQRMIYSTIAGK